MVLLIDSAVKKDYSTFFAQAISLPKGIEEETSLVKK